MYTNNDITSSFHTYLFLRSIPERCILEGFFAEYCIVGIPHNTAI